MKESRISFQLPEIVDALSDLKNQKVKRNSTTRGFSLNFDIENYALENLQSPIRSGKRDQEIQADCPDCGKESHFYISTETGNFTCFKCGFSGRGRIGVTKLVSRIEDISFNQAKRIVNKSYVNIKRRTETIESLKTKVQSLRERITEEERKPNVPLPGEYIPVWQKGRGWSYPEYLKSRNIDKQSAKEWKLGYCRSGDYSNRIIFPILSPNGNAFTSRAIYDDMKPRYRNPPVDGYGGLVYGWHTIGKGMLVLVEGPTDAIRIRSYGFSVLSLLGKTLSNKQAKLLKTLHFDKPIVIMIDPEEVVSPYKICFQLCGHFEKLFVARLPGVDPDDASKEQVLDSIRRSERFTGSKINMLRARLKTP